MIDGQSRDACPRCGSERLRAWRELTEEQRELVRRLPASADFGQEERAARHRWCARCWHEETRDAGRTA
jgi:DNA-directed RNA polymerase subunit RPC12/RpoP